MKQKSIELVISESVNLDRKFLPLDVLLISGEQIGEKSEDLASPGQPIQLKSINYVGTTKKVPYESISTLIPFSLENI